MKRSGEALAGACLSVVLLTGHAVAQTSPSSRSVRTAAMSAPAARAPQSQMAIYGAARTSSNAPVPGAPIRLRDARKGRIVARTRTDVRGEFVFHVSEPGLYVPELLDDTGLVIAAGDMLSIDFGQSVATIVRLPVRIPRFGWFGDAAGAIASAATSAGILAIAVVAPAATPGR